MTPNKSDRFIRNEILLSLAVAEAVNKQGVKKLFFFEF